ncbi:MAG: hypothetical protein WC859_06010 [Elusimicrobiota bacterium]
MKKKVKAKAKPAKKASRTRKTAKRPVKKVLKTKKAKKAAPAKTPAPPRVIAPPNSVLLGIVEDYFAKVGVIALTLQSPVSLGDRIQVLGHTTHIEQTVDSMQIDHLPVTQAGLKDGVGIKVIQRARAGDHVYLLQ